MLAKSFKMVPVMAWGVTISGKSYQLLDWLIAMAVTGGCMMFLICGDVRATQSKEAATGAAVYIGMALWAANKSFEALKFKFKFPRARTFELLGLVLGCIDAKFHK